MTSEFLYYRNGRIAHMRFNRPEKLNAYTAEMYEAMIEAFNDFQRDDKLRVAILSAEGGKAFCTGADLKTTVGPMTKRGGHFTDRTKRFFSDIYKPIIAVVDGYCLAGGMEILQGTDLRIASPHSTFGLPEVRWGLTPGGGSHVRLPRQIPWAIAMEILLLGRPITAQRAYEIGLINRVVPSDQLLDTAEAMANTLLENGPAAVQAVKEGVIRSLSLETPFAIENLIAEQNLRHADVQEGLAAFAERRPARWRDDA
ncbi:MAG TPA: enoyl-CoA hydratase-related protein [Natronosporangium sp.]